MKFTENFTPYKLPIFKNGVRLPEIIIPDTDKTQLGLKPTASNAEFLKKLTWVKCLEKIQQGKIRQSKEECAERLKFEFDVFAKTGTIDYILLLMDIFLWCDKNNVARGVGRGSAAGSLALMILDLTNINPLDHDLNFTRFLNESRAKTHFVDNVMHVDGKSFADFDGDVSFSRRPDIIRRIEKDYAGKTCKILTMQYLTGKMALKDTVKSFLEYNETEALDLGDCIESVFGKVDSLEKTYTKSKKFKEWADKNKEAYEIAQKIEGLFRTTGQHASGVLVSYYNLEDIIPMQLAATGEVVSGYDMDVCLTISLKADLLGLRTTDVLQLASEAVGIKYVDIKIDDPSIYRFFELTEDFYGLFQIEAGLTKEVIKKVKPKNIDQLAACLSISRPGALKFIDDYVKFVQTGEFKKIHPLIDKILEQTGGLILYQEQINNICQSVYKMNGVDSDEVRRCVTKDTCFISKTRGWISIESLLQDGYIDDLFLVMDENGKQQWKKIQNIWSTGKQTTRYVKASNGMFVKSNRWHRFLTNHGWKARRHLSTDDYLVCAKEISYDGRDSISIDLAMVIAGLLTEGYFVEGNSSATFTNFDSDIMNQFATAFSNVFGENRLTFDSLKRVARIKKADKDILRNYMPAGKSRGKYLPLSMMGMTYDSTRIFLGFIFSCEATIGAEELSFSSASIKFAQQIQLLLLRFGIRSNFYSKFNEKYQKDYYTVDIGDHKYVQKFYSIFVNDINPVKREALKILSEKEFRQSFTREVIPENILRKFNWEHSYVFNHDGSGRCFNGAMSFDKFERYAEASKDKKWIDFSTGKHEYSKVKSYDDLYDRETELFDFTVDEETPYIIANGIVIHNCIGKKNKDDMAKWEPVLYTNGEAHNISKDITKWFWDTCNASADYLFNANHCLSPDTMVESLNGFKPMFEMKAGEFIKAFNTKSKQDEYVKILNIMESQRELYEVELEDGRKIKASLDHKFLCEDMQMHKLKDILVNHFKIIITDRQLREVKSIKKLGVQNSMDFTVDSEDHNFYAEGIVTSNCYSYSYITAYTVYLKANYPLQFYLACLKMSQHEADPIDCISRIQGELQSTNIKLLMPDILKSKEDYTIDGNDIRMGLSGIKGLSGAALEKLKSFQATVSNKFDLFLSLQNSKIPVNILSSLVLSGCFDSVRGNTSRNKLLMEYEVFNELTPRETVFIVPLGAKYNYDLFAIIKECAEVLKNEKGKPLIKESRRETLRRNAAPFIEKYNRNMKFEELTVYITENHYLGFSYSHSLKKIYSKHIDGLVDIATIKTLPERREPYVVVAQILEAENRTSKNKKNYVKYTVKDDSGSLMVMDFQLDQRDGKTYKEGMIAVLHLAKKKVEDGNFLYFINDIIEQEVPVVLKTSTVRKEMEEAVKKE